MFDNASEATWAQFRQCVDMILALNMDDDVAARTIAHLLFIVVDIDGMHIGVPTHMHTVGPRKARYT